MDGRNYKLSIWHTFFLLRIVGRQHGCHVPYLRLCGLMLIKLVTKQEVKTKAIHGYSSFLQHKLGAWDSKNIIYTNFSRHLRTNALAHHKIFSRRVGCKFFLIVWSSFMRKLLSHNSSSSSFNGSEITICVRVYILE